MPSSLLGKIQPGKFTSRTADLEEVLKEWLAEGCDHLFSANFRVPDKLLEGRTPNS
jgi:hypothetical protein